MDEQERLAQAVEEVLKAHREARAWTAWAWRWKSSPTILQPPGFDASNPFTSHPRALYSTIRMMGLQA